MPNETEYRTMAQRPPLSPYPDRASEPRVASALEMVRQLASDTAERATQLAKMVDSAVENVVGHLPPMPAGPTNGQAGVNMKPSQVDDLRASLERIIHALNAIEGQVARL